MHSSHALWKASIGVYRALAICTVLVRIARVTAGLDSAICAAMEKKRNWAKCDSFTHLCFFSVNLRQIISALTDRWSSPPMSKYCCGRTRHPDSSDTCQSHMCYQCTGAGSGTVWCRFRSPDTFLRSDNGLRRFLHTRAHTNNVGALIPGHIIKAHFNCSFSLFQF